MLKLSYYTYYNRKKAIDSWGGTWSLPTVEQCQILSNQCNWTWKEGYTFGGKTMNGYIVSDKNDSSKSIFIPAAGVYKSGRIINQGYPCFWTSSAQYFYYGSRYNWEDISVSDPSILGLSIRPVLEIDSNDGYIKGHGYVKLAGYKWATENVGEAKGVDAIYKNDTYGYLYTQFNAKDAAESWGGTWTLPTREQWQKLHEQCDWTWKNNYSYGGKNMNGCIVSDKNDPSKCIFLPAAGLFYVQDGTWHNSSGYYWSTNNESVLFGYDWEMRSNRNPYNGEAVRPVSK